METKPVEVDIEQIAVARRLFGGSSDAEAIKIALNQLRKAEMVRRITTPRDEPLELNPQVIKYPVPASYAT